MLDKVTLPCCHFFLLRATRLISCRSSTQPKPCMGSSSSVEKRVAFLAGSQAPFSCLNLFCTCCSTSDSFQASRCARNPHAPISSPLFLVTLVTSPSNPVPAPVRSCDFALQLSYPCTAPARFGSWQRAFNNEAILSIGKSCTLVGTHRHAMHRNAYLRRIMIFHCSFRQIPPPSRSTEPPETSAIASSLSSYSHLAFHIFYIRTGWDHLHR